MSNQQTRAHATDQAKLDEITERLRQLGCKDHGCVVSKPKGVGTNGGCRCFEWQHLLPDERVRLREVDEITQDTPADLAAAIRARGTGGAR